MQNITGIYDSHHPILNLKFSIYTVCMDNQKGVLKIVFDDSELMFYARCHMNWTYIETTLNMITLRLITENGNEITFFYRNNFREMFDRVIEFLKSIEIH